jgi:hypothetical protein
MAGSVTVTINGSFDETATQQTGMIAGSGKLTIDIHDITKTSIAVDYKDEDRLKVSLQSEETLGLFADSSLKISSGVNYDILNKGRTGSAGLDLEISKDVKMSID